MIKINIRRKLKIKLDRKSLENIDAAFMRSLLEYDHMIWHNEAARLATGTTKLISTLALYSEIRYSSLKTK